MMSFDPQLIRSEHLERRRRLRERGGGHGRERRSTRAPRSSPYRLDGTGLDGTGLAGGGFAGTGPDTTWRD